MPTDDPVDQLQPVRMTYDLGRRGPILPLVFSMTVLGLSGCFGGLGLGSNGSDDGNNGGAVYTLTNADGPNQLVIFERDEDGDLARSDTVDTGGQGEGRGGPSPFPFAVSGTSNPIVLNDDADRLFAVNPGSNDISAFRVDNDDGSLTFVETQSSVGSLGSARPISLAMADDDLLYVLNAGTATPQSPGGSPAGITGFSIDDDGSLDPISGSTQPLTSGTADPSQIAFSADDEELIVTDKTSRTIITYPLDDDGVAGQPNGFTSAGQTPFGFDITDGNTLIVSDANVVPGSGPVANGGTVSSYDLDDDPVSVISDTLAADGTATCWVEVTADNDYAYVTNTFSGTVTGYAIDDGSLARLTTGPDNNGITPVIDRDNPEVLDMAIADGFLYVADAGSANPASDNPGTISAFRIEDDGSLTPLNGIATDLPNTTVGVAAF